MVRFLKSNVFRIFAVFVIFLVAITTNSINRGKKDLFLYTSDYEMRLYPQPKEQDFHDKMEYYDSIYKYNVVKWVKNRHETYEYVN